MFDLTLLVLSDIHFFESAQAGPPDDKHQWGLADELVQRAVLDARRAGGFDALLLLGDLTNTGDPSDLAAIEQITCEAAGDVPRITVPGNHDRDTELVLSVFADRPGMHEIGGYRIYSFADRWDENDVCLRSQEALERFVEEARAAPDKPLIVMQHNPLHPPIESDYPYIPPNREAIMSAYSEAGVLLSLSGHYHVGQPLSEAGGVRYYTCPAIGDSPFPYALVRLRGQDVNISEYQLRLPDSPPLFDVHVHTHYAYCGAGISAEEAIRRAEVFGLSGLCLTEHADQLYLTRQQYESDYACNAPDYWCTPRSADSERMPRYKTEVQPLRNEFVRLGLEVELDKKGRPAVRASDRNGWDLLTGAVHWTPGGTGGLSLDEVKQRFIRDTERILQSGVDVLAHPFRFFRRNKLAPPRDLYRPVAQLLAGHGAAAEINFHTNKPDPEFFAVCIEEGVKIALGSDAHDLREVGDFRPHLSMLRQAAGQQDVEGLIFRRPWQ